MQTMKKMQSVFLFTASMAAVAGAFAMDAGSPFAAAKPTLAGKAVKPPPREEMVLGLIVKPRVRGGEKMAAALTNRDSAELSRIAKADMSVFRRMSGGAHVVRMSKPVPLSEARAIAARLMHEGSVEMAEPDRVVRPLAPATDPLYLTRQWHYKTPDALNPGGANLPAAWDVTTGNASVVVAVLDTGILPHEDIAPAAILPGFDFIRNFSDRSQPRANDGNARDDNAADPGDFVTSGDFCFDTDKAANNNSSWHGTHVAGTIIASMNNALGGTGIAPGAKVLPVRVLGTCGGVFSDIIDGMRWAAGISDAALPASPAQPARVLNLSLGGASGTCGGILQQTIDQVTAKGTVVIAATGNENAIGVLQPANCNGVVAVTAHSIDGDTTTYANIGPETALSAPGGGCGETNAANGKCVSSNSPGVLSAVNTGLTSPGNDTYAGYIGTSMAAPHVSGVAALMLSQNSSLSPAQIKTYLQSSARAFPATSACVTRPSYAGRCGAGLLDANAALQAIAALPPFFTSVTPNAVVAPATPVVLSATAMPSGGKTLASYQWTQLSGPPVSISDPGMQNVSFTAPATGVLSFEVRATDSAGQSSIATVVIRVNSIPVPIPVPEQSVATGGTLNLKLEATDADNDTIVFAPLSKPDGSELSSDGTFVWPNAAPAGAHVLKYTVSDQDGSAEGSVTINVTQPKPSGGGGTMEGGMLFALAVLAAARRIRRAVVSSCRAQRD